MKRPEVGDIAICKQGCVGLVTEIVYKPDRAGVNRKLWKGIQLDKDKIGGKWESRAPRYQMSARNILKECL